MPPIPYDYKAFLAWFRRTNFANARGVAMLPQVSWFDVDAALCGKRAKWFEGLDTSRVMRVAKSINRFAFMTDIMRSGDDTAQASLVMHLYILQSLLPVATSRGVFLDAGCGTGYLLLAWLLLAGEGSRAVGIDIDAANVAATLRHLADPGAHSLEAKLPQGARFEAEEGDALALGPHDIKQLGLAPGTVDAINLGAAVDEQAQLDPLFQLLRPGGLLVAPLCLSQSEAPEQPLSPMPPGMCRAHFRLWRRLGNEFRPVLARPEAYVRFVRARMINKTCDVV